jgi:hypothetical protein
MEAMDRRLLISEASEPLKESYETKTFCIKKGSRPPEVARPVIKTALYPNFYLPAIYLLPVSDYCCP